jgi:hypothetical protein
VLLVTLPIALPPHGTDIPRRFLSWAPRASATIAQRLFIRASGGGKKAFYRVSGPERKPSGWPQPFDFIGRGAEAADPARDVR